MREMGALSLLALAEDNMFYGVVSRDKADSRSSDIQHIFYAIDI